MKHTSTIQLIGAILIASTCSILAQDEPFTPFGEWSLSVDFISPSADVWTSAGGGAVKYTHWRQPGRGVSFSAGLQYWEVDNEIYTDVIDLGGGYASAYASGLEGNAYMIPLTISGVFQKRMDERWLIEFEAGFRYVVVNSDIQFTEGEALGFQGQVIDGSIYTDDVEVGNNLMTVFSLELLYQPKDPGYYWFLGAGTQLDALTGDFVLPATPIAGEETFDNELQALFMRVGIRGQF